ncbi:FAD-dependent oxidoreductase [Pedomonas mirosovicensis]|uniref:FAD-dependent oxidoreductase n=1 Tax=Pedomonas mirosovicensis TaxID=2908641 RepID=UPI00286F74D7|nr:FAD-dependent oxidoreductase [Pedomonas mirosovicensis]
MAIALDRLEKATTFTISRPERSWAGLRTFAPDRVPVYGFEPDVPGFFWCAGQGGFGMQTAPAAGALCASLILGEALPQALADAGVNAASYAPARFRK